MKKNEPEILAGDGLMEEIRYISESGVKEYEFKNHYEYDYIAGRVRQVACRYINNHIHRYYSLEKKKARENGWYTAGLPYPRIVISELDEFFDLEVTRDKGTDKVVMHVRDMSEEKFRQCAVKMFRHCIEKQKEGRAKAFA
ncbi:MAG: hypothetical protein ACI4CS_00485 [Candidatus Weimeria sp.]